MSASVLVAVIAAILAVVVTIAVKRRRAPRTRALLPSEDAVRPAGIRESLAKTRSGVFQRILPLLGRHRLNADTVEQLEISLLAADVGTKTTKVLVDRLQLRGEGGLELDRVLEEEIVAILDAATVAAASRRSTPPEGAPLVLMVVGVNGVGKTTSIGKLAAWYARAGKRVLLVAADTFRAAAIEQLTVWAERSGVDLVRQEQGGDPGAVAFDGVRAAVGRHVDVAIVDTAGRLHTKTNLMDELRKVRRVIGREVPGAPHETFLVIDAVTGQNGLAQARAFLEHIEITGVILTKLDGTARGGIVLAIAGELNLPIRYVGVGEGIEDLREFDSREFASALLAPPELLESS